MCLLLVLTLQGIVLSSVQIFLIDSYSVSTIRLYERISVDLIGFFLFVSIIVQSRLASSIFALFQYTKIC